MSTTLSENAVNVLISARERISFVLRDAQKKKDDIRWGMARMLDEAHPNWRPLPIVQRPVDLGDLAEIDSFLRRMRTDKPKLKTAESRTRTGLRVLGFDMPNGHGTSPADDDWAAYEKKCPTEPAELSVFISECRKLKLGPDKVTNDTLATVLAKWREGRPEHSAKTAMRRIVRHFKTYPPTEGYAYRMPDVTETNRKRDDLDPDLLEQFAAWGNYRIHGDSVLTPVGDTTAAREVAILQYLAGYTDDPPSIACVTALLVPSTAEASLDAMKKASELKDQDDGWGAMAYEAARILRNIANSHFLASLSLPMLPAEDCEGLDELATTYSPKGHQDLSLRLRNKLRVFSRPEKVAQFLNLPETLGAGLVAREALTFHEKTRLTVAFALRLVFEVPETAARMAGVPLDAFHEATSSTVLVHLPGSNGDDEDKADGDLSAEGIALYRGYRRLVRDTHEDVASPFLFLGRGEDHKSPAWFSRQIVMVTGNALGVGLSVQEIRWVLAFLTLVQDRHARDLAAGYLGHKRRSSIEPLLKLVDDWRQSGVFETQLRPHSRENE